ncbi:MAG: ThuA domain-containing protein [Acidobacteria bacterium]|nr:ThuA domain-containing protein [Acidobacteriota bacterium]
MSAGSQNTLGRRTLLLGLPAAWAAAAQGPIRALIVDGFSNHDGPKTTAFLKDLLENTGRFRADVSTSPHEVGDPAWAKWRPRFADYDLVVQTANNIQQPELRWPREVEQALEAFVRNGGGLLVHHSANNAFPHWAEYNGMIGLGWRGVDEGTALRLDADGAVTRIPPGQGEKTSHGPRQDTVVHRLTPHPINHGMPEKWLTPDIEVYTYARGPAEALTILSYGRHHATDTWWPLEWVVAYGNGRVYSSSFGHIWKTDEGIPARVRCVGFQTTVIRAAEWLATGAATWPIPEDFPTERTLSIRPA